MIRVIRNRVGSYFKDGEWTDQFPAAEKFSNVADVVAAKKRLGLQEVDLVLIIHDQPSPKWDVVLPLFRAGP